VLRFIRRFGVLATGTAVIGAVLPAVAASAATVPGRTFISAETNFDSTVYKSVRVFCPSGLQVIGGGYKLVGAEGAVVLDDFIPSADNLLVGAGEIVGPGEASDGTTASWKVVATVVCANPLPNYSIQTATSDFSNAPGTREVKAMCPPGRHTVSGGASLSNGFGQVSILLMTSGETTSTADAGTDLDGYSGNWSVTSYVICADQLSGWHEYQATSASGTTLSATSTSFCPGTDVAISVGWRTFGTVVGVIDRYHTQATFNTGSEGVTTTAVGPQSASQNWQDASYAICVSA
jgi:hypothetical protein